jgi:methylmalonyl-CoA mutase cobalamin-binding subunit
VQEVVTAALQEDVQGIAISSYQGGTSNTSST